MKTAFSTTLNNYRFIFLLFLFHTILLAHPLPQIKADHFFLDSQITYCPIANCYQYATERPSIISGKSNYFVVWEDERNSLHIYGTRCGRAGEVIDSAGILLSGLYGGKPKVATDGTDYLAAWIHLENTNDFIKNLYATRINESGNVLDSNILIRETQFVNGLDIAFGDSVYLITWLERLGDIYSDSGRIYGKRVSKTGVVLDSKEIAISPIIHGEFGDETRPAITYDGENFFVVWNHSNQFYGIKVNGNGKTVNNSGITLTFDTLNKDGERPAVAFGDTTYLVVWKSYDFPQKSDADIYGTLISRSGKLLTHDGFAISLDVKQEVCPEVRYNGQNFIVVWQKDMKDFYNICYTHISETGVTLDTGSVFISSWEMGSGYDGPCVSFDGINNMIVWPSPRINAYAFKNLYCSRVSYSGDVLDQPMMFTYSANSQGNPSIAFDGNNFMVVWSDTRKGDNFIDYSETYAARVDQSGNVIDYPAIPLAASPDNNQEYPVIAFGDTTYLFLWRGTGGLHASLVSPSGSIVVEEINIPHDLIGQAVAFNGKDFMVAGAVYGPEIKCFRLSAGGTVIDSQAISLECRGVYPKIAAGRSTYLVIWGPYNPEKSNRGYGGKRVSFEGVVLDSKVIAFQGGNGSIAFDGNNYLVAGNQYADSLAVKNKIVGNRVSEAGIKLDTIEILNVDDTISLTSSTVFDGENFLVIGYSLRKIFITKVTPEGKVLGTTTIPAQGKIMNGETPVAITHAPAKGKSLIVYSAMHEYVNNRPANSFRLRGFLYESGPVAIKDIQQTLPAAADFKIFYNAFTKNISVDISNRYKSIQSKIAIELKLFNSRGQLLTSKDSIINPQSGVSTIRWNLRENRAQRLPRGICFVHVRVNNLKQIKKVLLF